VESDVYDFIVCSFANVPILNILCDAIMTHLITVFICDMQVLIFALSVEKG